MENEHYEALLEQGTMMLERHIKGQLEESLPEDLKPVRITHSFLLYVIRSEKKTNHMIINLHVVFSYDHKK